MRLVDIDVCAVVYPEAWAVIAVVPGAFVTVKLPVAWVCPKGIVSVEPIAPTVGCEEKRFTLTSAWGSFAGRPCASCSCTWIAW